MASDLTLRLATFPTPLGPFTVVASDEGVVATTTGDADALLRRERGYHGHVRAAQDGAALRREAVRQGWSSFNLDEYVGLGPADPRADRHD